MTFDGKKILLIAPRYFGYDQAILDELLREGAQVDMLPDRPFDTPLLKAATRFRPELTQKYSDGFYARALDGLATDYNIVLVVQGESVTSATLAAVRRAYPRSRLVFYSWDSLRMKPHARSRLSAYDACLTFDANDARAYGMTFRPLFFSPGFERHGEFDCHYELSFVGTIHADRYKIVRSIDAQLESSDRRFWYLYMQARWMYRARKLFGRSIRGALRDEFSFHPLSQKRVQEIFLTSRAVLDIEHPRQEGLTMRTLEALGSQTKLVTTNSSVRNFDFFDESNICVIERGSPVLPKDFLHSPYRPLPQEIYERYTLRRWLQEVCEA